MNTSLNGGQLSAGAANRKASIAPRTFVFTKGGPAAGVAARGGGRQSMGGGGGMPLSAGVSKALASSGVTSFKGNRETEKREMQGLNERFASYIEKMHFKDAEIQRLTAENEALRNRKGESLQPIRDMYESELAQARQAIDDMSSKQGVAEARVAGLEDEIQRLNDLISTYESQALDYRKKIEMLGATNMDLEAEIAALKARVGGRENEGDKSRALVTKYQDQIRQMRQDLDAETAAHIEAECLAQTKTEEAAFYKELLDKLEDMKPEPVQIKGMDASEFWQSNMKKAIREIQQAADEKVDMIQQDCEAKVAAQMNTMRTSGVKEQMQASASKEESTRLKSQLSDKNAAMAALQQKLASMQAENERLRQLVNELETDRDADRLKYTTEIAKLNDELESVMEQLKVLMDAKLSMELEIACYQKLLEGEENRVSLGGAASSALGTQSSGAASLASALSGGSGSQMSMSQSMGKMTVQRQSKGAVGFASVDHAGGSITLECDATHSQARSGQNLNGWKVQKVVGGRTQFSATLGDFLLTAGQSYTIWAKGAKSAATAKNELITDAFSFGVGTCTWQLFDASGAEKATLNATVSN